MHRLGQRGVHLGRARATRRGAPCVAGIWHAARCTQASRGVLPDADALEPRLASHCAGMHPARGAGRGGRCIVAHGSPVSGPAWGSLTWLKVATCVDTVLGTFKCYLCYSRAARRRGRLFRCSRTGRAAWVGLVSFLPVLRPLLGPLLGQHGLGIPRRTAPRTGARPDAASRIWWARHQQAAGVCCTPAAQAPPVHP